MNKVGQELAELIRLWTLCKTLRYILYPMQQWLKQEALTSISRSSSQTTVLDTYPATYRIDVEYNGSKFSFYDYSTYKKYSNRVGDYVNAIIQIKKYDDGTTKYNIIGLE